MLITLPSMNKLKAVSMITFLIHIYYPIINSLTFQLSNKKCIDFVLNFLHVWFFSSLHANFLIFLRLLPGLEFP